MTGADADAGIGDTHELRLLQSGDIGSTAIAHTRPQATNVLDHHLSYRTFVRNPAFDTFRHDASTLSFVVRVNRAIQSNETLDGSDDDVVARQLREAAEKETDPELREKLWKEYEQYKTNTAENTSTR